MRNASDKIVEKIKTHILCSITCVNWESCCLWDNVKNYCGAEQAPCDNKGQDHCILDS